MAIGIVVYRRALSLLVRVVRWSVSSWCRHGTLELDAAALRGRHEQASGSCFRAERHASVKRASTVLCPVCDEGKLSDRSMSNERERTRQT